MNKFMGLNVPEINAHSFYCLMAEQCNACKGFYCPECIFSSQNVEIFTQWLKVRKAAPDLLAACKEFMSAINESEDTDGAICDIEAAIAKAL